MKEYTSSVSPKGQITLPLEIGRQLGVKPKDRVVVTLDGDEVRVRRLGSPVETTFQAVPPLKESKSWKEVEQIAHEDHALDIAREVENR